MTRFPIMPPQPSMIELYRLYTIMSMNSAFFFHKTSPSNENRRRAGETKSGFKVDSRCDNGRFFSEFCRNVKIFCFFKKKKKKRTIRLPNYHCYYVCRLVEVNDIDSKIFDYHSKQMLFQTVRHRRYCYK